MKIYLDDERALPRWMGEEGGWVVVRSGEELMRLIADYTLSAIQEISLDNDLGTGMEGRHVLNEIERLVHEGQPCPELRIHTMNPVARATMWPVCEKLNRTIR